MNSIENRRILLCVTGLSPQVVTETLYGLAYRNQEPWVPHEIHLVTTHTGAESARLNLLHGNGWFRRLCADYELPPIEFPVENIHVLTDAQGAVMDDIRNQEQNTFAADFITDLVRQYTIDSNSELHVSIAGGRKTMGYYLGYALSLYGRPQDRLSHVLVSDPYETNRDFYYPTPYDHPIHVSRGGKEMTVDAKNANIELAEIPFVRLRTGLPPRLISGRTSFSQAISIANRGLAEPKLILDTYSRKAWVDGESLELRSTEFLIMYWLAGRVKRGTPLTAWSENAMGEEFLQLAKTQANFINSDIDRIKTAINSSLKANDGSLATYFEPHKSRIKKGIDTVLGDIAAERYVIQRKKDGHVSMFYLPLEDEQIEIVSGKCLLPL